MVSKKQKRLNLILIVSVITTLAIFLGRTFSVLSSTGGGFFDDFASFMVKVMIFVWIPLVVWFGWTIYTK